MSKSAKFISLLMGVDVSGTKAGIKDDLRQILAEKQEALMLDVKLNKKELAGLKKLLAGDEITAPLAKNIVNKVAALQKDAVQKYVGKDKRSDVSEFAKIQKQEAIAMVKDQTQGKNVRVLNVKDNLQTKDIEKLEIAYEDLDGQARIVNATFKNGEIVLDQTVTGAITLKQEIQKINTEMKAYYNGMLSLKENMIKKGLSEVDIQDSLLNYEKLITEQREKHAKLMKDNLSTGNIDESAKKTHEDNLASHELNLKRNQATKILGATQQKNAADAKDASEKLIKNESSIAALKKQILLDDKANQSIIKTKIADLQKQNVELRKTVELSEEATQNFNSRKDQAVSNSTQKVEEKYSNKNLKDIEAYNRKALKELKILEVAKRTGNAADEAASKKRLMELSAQRVEILKTSRANLEDRDVRLDFERRLGLLHLEQIDHMKVIRAETEAIVNAEEARIANKFGTSENFTEKTKQQSVLSDADMQKISSSEKEFAAYAKTMLGAKAELIKFNDQVQEGGRILASGIVNLKQSDGTIKQYTLSMDKARKSVLLTNEAVHKGSQVHMGFAERLKLMFGKLTAYVGVSTLIYGALNKIREGFTFVLDLDKQLTQTAITFGMTKLQTDELGESYTQMAIKMGKTTMEIAEANTELVRQGLSLRESKKRLEEVIKLSAVGAISTTEALKVITTGVNAMKVSAQEMSDVLVYAGQISASSVEELGEAFQKVASSAYSSNMRLTETASILAVITEVTQEDASSVGTSLKTMIARFNNITDEASGMGEELNKVQTAIESVGVKFVDSAGQVRNLFDILKDLNKVWAGLDKNTRSYIATQAAGTRQQNKFFAVMDNYNRVLELNTQLTDSAGKLNKGYEVYLQSLESQVNRTKASLEALWNDDLFPQIIGGVNTLATVVSGFIKDFGLVESLIGGGFGLLAIGEVSKGMTESFKFLGEKAVAAAQLVDIAEGQYTMSAVRMAKAGAGLKAIFTEAGQGFSVFLRTLMASAPILLAVGAALGAAAIGWAIYSEEVEKAKRKQEKAVSEIQTFTSAVLDQKKNLIDLKKAAEEYNILKRKVGEGSAKGSLGTEEYARFLELNDQILEILPNVKTETNAQGEVLLSLSASQEKLNDQLTQYLEMRRAQLADSESYLSFLDAEKEKAEEYEKSLKKAAKAKQELDNLLYQRRGDYVIVSDDQIAEAQAKKDEADLRAKEMITSWDLNPAIASFVALNNIIDDTSIALLQTKEYQDLIKKQLVDNPNGHAEVWEKAKDELFGAQQQLKQYTEEYEAVKKKIDSGDKSYATQDDLQRQIKAIAKYLAIIKDPEAILLAKQLGEELQNLWLQIKGENTLVSDVDPYQQNFDIARKKIEALIALKEKLTAEDSIGLNLDDAKALGEAGYDFYEISQKILDTGGDKNKQQNLLRELIDDTTKSEVAYMKAAQASTKAVSDRFKAAGSSTEKFEQNGEGPSRVGVKVSPEMELMLDFIQALIGAFAKVGTSSGEAKLSLEKYFDTLEKISYSQQRLDFLAFEDDNFDVDRTKQRVAELKNLHGLQENLEKQRRKRLQEINNELKKTSKSSNKYVELREEAREEQEALNTLMQEQVAIEMTLIEVRESNFNKYKEEGDYSETLNSKLALYEAQGDKGLNGKLAITQLLIQSEEDYIAKKMKEQEIIRKEAQALNITETQREALLDKIIDLEMQIDTHKTNILGLAESELDVEKRRKDMIEEEKNSMRDLLGLVEDMVRSEEEQLIATREERLRLAKEELDIQLEALDAAKDRDDFERDRLDKLDNINKIKQKMASLEVAASTGDTKAANEILKLQDDLIAKEKELDTFTREDSFKQQKAGIQEVYDTLEKEIEDANRESQAFLNDMEAVMAKVQGRINDHLNGSIDLYQQLMDWNRKHGTGIDVDVTQKWDLAYESLKKYVELAGSFDVNDFMNNFKGTSSSTSSTGTSDKERLTDAQKSLLIKMEERSKAWRNTTDPDAKKRYAADNQVDGAKAGFTFDASKGLWYASLADQMAGIKLYDNGGLKPKGEMGIMAKNVKEWVFDDNQLKQVQRAAITEFLESNRASGSPTASGSNVIQININGDITDKNVNKIAGDIKDIVAKVSQGQVEIFKQRGLKPAFNGR